METLSPSVLEVIEYEKSNWAHGSVYDDPFYQVTADVADLLPGSVIKAEKDVVTSKYLLPPATAMSRFIYQSENLQGVRVPVSAFILWPFSPISLEDRFPIVAWAHGTSGTTAPCAPSNHKSLWQHFLAPYQLALQGYVVVATDYAGLGVHKHASGEPIIHQYMACPSHANDIAHAVTAAQEIFPELSKKFVVIGHSQGGGAAWAMAQRQVHKPIPGYLGAIAVSPFTSIYDQSEQFQSIIVAAMCEGLVSTMPRCNLSEILTEKGQHRLALAKQFSTGIASLIGILEESDLLKEGWAQNEFFQKYHSLVSNGGKEIAGPLLVIHGETDQTLSSSVCKDSVMKTFQLDASQIEFVTIPSVTHVPALSASQRLWLEWIADRFAGRKIKMGLQQYELPTARPPGSYQTEQNWYIDSATKGFHAPS
ncbi:MAG: hypothetical protein M1812_005741 [Candelaria pacifica]|nr:MAG: hypothetical protein M1812_005741 [Candelaria pacifica]